MKVNRKVVVAGVLVALAFHYLGIWAEAARQAAGIGFAERVDWGRLLAGFGKVKWDQILFCDHLYLAEYIALGGMFVTLAAAIMGVKWISKWVLGGYTLLLMAAGGWVGVWLFWGLFYFPLLIIAGSPRITGEFFEEGIARLVMASVWPMLVLVVTLAAFIKRRPLWMKSRITRHV